jgi:ATP-dependent DNA helicase PIF1
LLPGEERSYKSLDTVEEPEKATQYPTEFLCSLEPTGLAPHTLTLRIGCPVMLLRNIDPPKLCNGTCLIFKQMNNNVIEATILTRQAKGQQVFLPRIPFIPSDCPISFKRLQFPLRPCFAMTINKAQGQSLKVVGLNLESPFFSHVQF